MDSERVRQAVKEAKDAKISISFVLFLFSYILVNKFVELLTEIFKMWCEGKATISVDVLFPMPGTKGDSTSHEQSFKTESFYCTSFSPVVAYGGSYQDRHRSNLPFEQ